MIATIFIFGVLCVLIVLSCCKVAGEYDEREGQKDVEDFEQLYLCKENEGMDKYIMCEEAYKKGYDEGYKQGRLNLFHEVVTALADMQAKDKEETDNDTY